jgi:hypothetical protein
VADSRHGICMRGTEEKDMGGLRVRAAEEAEPAKYLCPLPLEALTTGQRGQCSIPSGESCASVN